MFLIAPLEKEFSEISIDIHTFSFKKMHLKISYGKWRPFCTGLKVKASCITQHSWHQSIQTNAVSCNFTALCWIYTTVLTSLGEAISWFIWFNDSNIMTDDLYEGTFRYIPLCGNSQVPRWFSLWMDRKYDDHSKLLFSFFKVHTISICCFTSTNLSYPFSTPTHQVPSFLGICTEC